MLSDDQRDRILLVVSLKAEAFECTQETKKEVLSILNDVAVVDTARRVLKTASAEVLQALRLPLVLRAKPGKLGEVKALVVNLLASITDHEAAARVYQVGRSMNQSVLQAPIWVAPLPSSL